jgi:hypothetical protein
MRLERLSGAGCSWCEGLDFLMKIRILIALLIAASPAYGGTVSGVVLGPSGLPIKNGTLTFTLQQAGLMVGSGSVVPTSASCSTSTDGSVVGIPNPLSLPVTSISYGPGTMAAGIYYVVYVFYDNQGNRTLGSPELQVQLTGSGSLMVAPPAAFPANAAGMAVYVGAVSGGETGQGNTVGPAQVFTQSATPVSTSYSVPTANATVCSVGFNDTIIPYSGYSVSLISSSGNAYPGWPQVWQLNGGLNGTVNISNGAPLWNGTIIYPQPIMSQPLNHGPQSISGLLNLSGYDLVNAGAVGVGTSTPSWALDVENGFINTNLGYLVGGAAGSSGQCLVSNGSYFVPGSCGSLPAVFYQDVQANGSILAQQPLLNFAPRLTAVNNGGATRTDVDLAASAVTPGSYTNASISVDGYGRVTSATNGPGIPAIQSLVINSGICSTGSSAYSTCSMSVSWPIAFSNSAYALACTPGNPTGLALNTIYFSGKTASGFTLNIQNADASGANVVSLTEVDCVGMHP